MTTVCADTLKTSRMSVLFPALMGEGFLGCSVGANLLSTAAAAAAAAQCTWLPASCSDGEGSVPLFCLSFFIFHPSEAG